MKMVEMLVLVFSKSEKTEIGKEEDTGLLMMGTQRTKRELRRGWSCELFVAAG